jgi:hypothetical protein
MSPTNPDQEQKFAEINDRYGIANWYHDGPNLVVVCDDGDEAEIYPNGTANWRNGSGSIT